MLFMNTNSIVVPKHPRQLKASIRCLVKMWWMRTMVQDWSWSNGFMFENHPHGRPEEDNDEQEPVVEADTPQTMCEIAARFDVSIPSVLHHLKEIGKIKKLDK